MNYVLKRYGGFLRGDNEWIAECARDVNEIEESLAALRELSETPLVFTFRRKVSDDE